MRTTAALNTFLLSEKNPTSAFFISFKFWFFLPPLVEREKKWKLELKQKAFQLAIPMLSQKVTVKKRFACFCSPLNFFSAVIQCASAASPTCWMLFSIRLRYAIASHAPNCVFISWQIYFVFFFCFHLEINRANWAESACRQSLAKAAKFRILSMLPITAQP